MVDDSDHEPCPPTHPSARGEDFEYDPPSSADDDREVGARVYVAAAQEDWPRARAAMHVLRAAGCIITADWTDEVESHVGAPATTAQLREYGRRDRDGVRSAHIVLCLTPDSKDKGCGLYGELAIGVDRGKRVIVTGPNRDRSIFAHLEEAERYETDLEGVAACL
jgi:hypothetical protein